jgi:DNA-binding LacI/PurR family transcriptional regulator
MTEGRVTIRDIAEMAKVSKGTVSRVLNEGPGVGKDTRQRVLKLIESLDFHPNASARGLAARRTNTIGFVIPHTSRYSMTSTFWPVLLTTITEQAATRGINVLLSTTRSEDDVDSAFRAILRGRRIDGAIVGAEQVGERQLAELLMKNIPFVMVGKRPHVTPWCVDVDNAAGARMATEHLMGMGHSSIAMLAGPVHLPYVQDRVRGFQQAMSAKGLDGSLILHCPYQTEEVIRAARQALDGSHQTTAIFLAAGDLVLGTLKACHELDRAVPEDLSLVSFDDHPFFAHFSPAITAVSQPLEEMGRAAVDMLFQLMDGKEPPRRAVVLPPLLVERGSCAAPPQRTA